MISSGLVAIYAIIKLFSGSWVIDFRGMSWKPDWEIIRALFRFGLPTGLQGIAMNIAGVLLLIHHLQPEGQETKTSSPSPSHATQYGVPGGESRTTRP
jgi:hypothetical protein